MKTTELRERFLSFFAAREHARVASDSLVPSGDPTVLFTSAGMNQFKPHFLGLKTDLSRATSCQKCLRTGDLDAVGDASHHSFFEMLGNFSFGDYFKKDAIRWGWEFLTGTLDYKGSPSPDRAKLCLGLAKEKLWVSVYEEDHEAFKLWRDLGLPEDRIRRFGQADNFWPANAPKEGPNGPCGPCSEIYFDEEGKVQGPHSLEVWNLVFTQYDRQPDGSLKPLPKPNIDTGMGLERLARVVQAAPTDYETDAFGPIMQSILATAKKHGIAEADAKVVAAQRTVADHLRAIVFLVGEGLMPSNEGRGYVLRLLIRRACLRAEKSLGVGIESGGLPAAIERLVDAVHVSVQGSPYHGDLAKNLSVIKQAVVKELQQFQTTLRAGREQFDQVAGRAKKAGSKAISGEDAFQLYDTYGFPFELTAELAAERGLSVDRAGFESALAQQQERSRAGSQFGGDVFVSDELRIRAGIPGLPARDAHFVGYDSLQADTAIKGIWDGKAWVTQLPEGRKGVVVLERSPFYGEAGGQVGDAGALETGTGQAKVEHTAWADDILVHQVLVGRGSLSVGQPVRASVDLSRRLQIARSHTATHMLHWALKKVLGDGAMQAGSYVDADRLRFDFSSQQGLHEEQRFGVESLVNARVRLADEVRTSQMRLDEAKRTGAVAMFGEKYGDRVRVVAIGDYSKELCGGTHLPHTGFVGTFKIVQESSIASGTRRIEALVGDAAAADQLDENRLLREAAKRLGRPVKDVVSGLEELLDKVKHLERERKTLQSDLAVVQAGRLKAEGKQIDGVTYIAAKLDRVDREQLKTLADALKASLSGDGAVLLASSEASDQVAWVMATTPGLSKRLHAGQVVKEVAAITQGSGGGRPDFAQAGGKDPSKIPDAFKRAEAMVREALERK